MQRARLAALAGTALLAGCALSGDYGPAPAIPAGSELVLHQRLAFAPGKARVYMQGGEVVPRGKVSRFRVACYLRIQRRGDEPLVDAVEPGTFLVIEGSRSWQRRFGRRIGGARVAAFGMREFPFGHERHDLITEIEIRSDRQPQVDELHCQYNGWPTDEPPGVARIQEALGEVATLRVAPPNR